MGSALSLRRVTAGVPVGGVGLDLSIMVLLRAVFILLTFVSIGLMDDLFDPRLL
jgi:hypothetical protein